MASSKTIEKVIPIVALYGLKTEKPATFGSTVAISGLLTNGGGLKQQVESVSDNKTVTAAMSGRMFVDVKGSATTTFTLPAAEAGLEYSFVCGNASGEILLTPASGDAIVGKTHGAENGTGIAPAAGTGIKNTAATNVVGDFCTLRALDATTWYMTSVAGVWASQ